MNYFLFFCNYFFGGISFACLVGGAWGMGIIFTLAYIFTYWLATRNETDSPPSPP